MLRVRNGDAGRRREGKGRCSRRGDRGPRRKGISITLIWRRYESNYVGWRCGKWSMLCWWCPPIRTIMLVPCSPSVVSPNLSPRILLIPRVQIFFPSHGSLPSPPRSLIVSTRENGTSFLSSFSSRSSRPEPVAPFYRFRRLCP